MSDYDVAEICLNGHVTNTNYSNYPKYNKKFCPLCASPTITKCDSCSTDIEGAENDSFYQPYELPAYCKHCGSPFPWTRAGIEVAQILIEEDENLIQSEKDLMIASLNDLSCETPRTPLAASRINKGLKKMFVDTKQFAYKAFVDIASETAKKMLTP